MLTPKDGQVQFSRTQKADLFSAKAQPAVNLHYNLLLTRLYLQCLTDVENQFDLKVTNLIIHLGEIKPGRNQEEHVTRVKK